MLINLLNVNQNIGNEVYDSLTDMRQSLLDSGYSIPDDDLAEGRDFVYIEPFLKTFDTTAEAEAFYDSVSTLAPAGIIYFAELVRTINQVTVYAPLINQTTVPHIDRIKKLLADNWQHREAIASIFAPGKSIESTVNHFRKWLKYDCGMNYSAAYNLVIAIRKFILEKDKPV